MKHETTRRIKAFRQVLVLAAAEKREELLELPRWLDLEDFLSGSCDLASNLQG